MPLVDPWEEVERRAAMGVFSGVRSDTDDIVDDGDLREAAINPNRQGAKGKDGGNGAMMPPMMGGRGGTATSGGSSAAGGGVVDAGAMGGLGVMGGATGAMRAPTGLSGQMVGGAAGASAGSGGLGIGGASGVGAGGTSGVMAAGMDTGDRHLSGGIDLDGDGIADVDHNGNPLGDGTDWGVAGDVNGDGVADRLVAGGLDTDGDGVADHDRFGNPLSGRDDPFSGGGDGSANTGAQDVTGPGGGGTSGEGWTQTQPGSPNGSSDPNAAGSNAPTTPAGLVSGTPGIRSGTAPAGSDGYVADPEALRQVARQWDELSAEMQAVQSASNTTSRFGLAKQVTPAHARLSGAAAQWSGGASREFEALTGKLAAVAGGYEYIEDANASIGKSIGTAQR